MQKRSKKIWIVVAISIIAFIVGVGGAYYLGTQRMKDDQAIRDNQYSTAIQSVRSERNRALNDYAAACYEYQTLYTAYQNLYAKTGASSGLPRYSSPDGARGNEESCYR